MLCACPRAAGLHALSTSPKCSSHGMQLAKWVKRVRDAKEIPLPGDIDVVVGGPPCQSITGFNRHGKRENVLEDVKCAPWFTE